jgi:GAF domain-containing protein
MKDFARLRAGRVAHLLTDTEDTAGTVRAVAEEGMRVFGAQRAGVFLLSENDSGLETVVALGLSDAYVDTVRARFREVGDSRTVLQGEARFSFDARADTASPLLEAVRGEGFAGVAALPLTYGGRDRVAHFYHNEPHEYQPG